MRQFHANQIRIALLDDHAVVRYGLSNRLSIEEDINVVGAYENGSSLIRGLRVYPAEILVMDFSLGPTDVDGISLIKAIKIKFPEMKILVISSHYEAATVGLALRAGARGFVGKEQALEKIVQAIRKVQSGAIYLEPEMAYKVVDAIKRPVNSKDELMGDSVLLSNREREVIRCFLDGLTVTEIAEKFGRSIKTISTQKSSAYRKLGVTSDNGLFKIKQMLQDI